MAHWVLVRISGSLVTFLHVADGKVAETGRLDMSALDMAGQKQAFQSGLDKIAGHKGAIALYLPEDQVLGKNIFLPLAADENLRQVISFEMDRYTPFNAGQVYFDYRLVHRDKQLEIALAVAPHDVIDGPLRQLAAWGAQAKAVLVAGDVTDNACWNLLPEELRNDKNMRMSRLNAMLAAGAMALLFFALALPIWQKREFTLSLRPLLDEAHKKAQVADGLRNQLEPMMAEHNYLLDKKRESPPVVAVLEDVTHILPNDTWVQQFDLKGKEMLIQGETASSSKLIGLFEQAKTLHDASFRAPLTKGQDANSERFQLAAETRPLPRAETERLPLPPEKSIAQPVIEPPEPDSADELDAIDALEVQEKEKPGKQPAMVKTEKTDSKPAPKSGEKPASAPAARTENKP